MKKGANHTQWCPVKQESHNIDFAKKEDKVYTATLLDLPEDDLSFTIYADEQIELSDKVIGRLKNRFGYYTPFVIGAIAFLIIGVIIVRVVSKKNK